MRSIELNPEENSMKHLHLGQLLQGKEAAQCFQRGRHLLLRQREAIARGGVTKQRH